MARKTWQTAADWQTGVAENLEITDAGVKLARPEPAQFTRASEAYKSDGTLVASGVPRYEGAGVLIEEGTTNLIPLAKQKFEGWTAYSGAEVTLTQGIAVPEWGASDATRIQTSGGTHINKYYIAVEVPLAGDLRAERIYVKNTGDKTVRVHSNVGAVSVDVPPGESKLVKLENIVGDGAGYMQISFRALNIADSLDFIAWRPMSEAKPLCTSWTDGTRSPESLSVPVPFAPAQGGEISFSVEVNDACKRRVVGQYPRLIEMTRAIGGAGMYVAHSESVAQFTMRTLNDAGEYTQTVFSDSLIPNGTRELKIRQTLTAVILYCDGQPIATTDNPALPSGWGRAYPLSSATGTYQAGTTVGNLRMVVG